MFGCISNFYNITYLFKTFMFNTRRIFLKPVFRIGNYGNKIAKLQTRKMGWFDFFSAPELKPNEPYRGYEQPSWKLMPNQPEDNSFQIRCYPTANWATTRRSENDNRSFWKLFGYIQGSNNKEQKMSMTVPVTMEMSQKSEEEYTMSFFTPASFQTAPPDPSNPDVFIENRKEIVVYVRTFGGFAKRPQFREQSKLLYHDILKHGVDSSKLDPNNFYAVGYDSPFRLINRRNEVWLVEKNESSPAEKDEDPVEGNED